MPFASTNAATVKVASTNAACLHGVCPGIDNFASLKQGSGTSVFWSLEAITAPGVMGANRTCTLIPELVN